MAAARTAATVVATLLAAAGASSTAEVGVVQQRWNFVTGGPVYSPAGAFAH